MTGPTDAEFEFSVEVENKSDQEGIFNLTAQGPENWTMNFKPAYEDKFISSLRLKAGQSQTMAVEVKPNPWANPGQYPMLVRISSPKAEGQVALTVVLTGTYQLEAGTANGLLSLNAVRGEPTTLSFYVKNTGSAVLNMCGSFHLNRKTGKCNSTRRALKCSRPRNSNKSKFLLPHPPRRWWEIIP